MSVMRKELDKSVPVFHYTGLLTPAVFARVVW